MFLMAPTTARALSGVQLYQFCIESSKSSTAGISCEAYMRGFVDGMMMGSFADELHHFCPPKGGVSVDQARLIVEKYLRDHPERLNREAGVLAGIALAAAFPCGPNQNAK
jgi:hypothetical protein